MLIAWVDGGSPVTEELLEAWTPLCLVVVDQADFSVIVLAAVLTLFWWLHVVNGEWAAFEDSKHIVDYERACAEDDGYAATGTIDHV